MTDFTRFTSQLREFIARVAVGPGSGSVHELSGPPGSNSPDDSRFNALALELFQLQFEHNIPYRRFCQARGATPQTIGHWTQIPAIATSAFKDLELSCLAAGERSTVFHSSGTTAQRPSRHFHSLGSLAVYEASLWQWFREHLLQTHPPAGSTGTPEAWKLILLTPPPSLAPHSSLVHMLEAVRRQLAAPHSSYAGKIGEDQAWTIDFPAALAGLREATASRQAVLLIGTAFSFVHLIDALSAERVQFKLPIGSRVMETGGYKGRSRSLPKPELHGLITRHLGISTDYIVSEYGMSELSSQAYDRTAGASSTRNSIGAMGREAGSLMRRGEAETARLFIFPPWARAQVVSPETGEPVAEGESGLIRIYDLANVFSVMAVQTEDLGIQRGRGFESLGRAVSAAPRGCSLMNV